MKRTVDDLAFFGGKKVFESAKPIGQLAVPRVEEFLDLARHAWNSKRLTGHGRIERELEAELAAYHNVAYCVATANAGLALMLLMRVFAGDRNGEVVMPAFSYRGLPHFARWAGQRPRFCEVDCDTHTLIPEEVAKEINENTTSVLAVMNFNSPGDIRGLSEIAARYRVPLFFDSVYAVGGSYEGTKLGGFGRAEVYSLHATKLLNGFEGGYVTTQDLGLAQELRNLRDGVCNCECFGVPPLDARLNELHAALGLLSLREVDSIIVRNRNRYLAYEDGLQGLAGIGLIPYLNGGEESYNYQMAVLEVRDGCPFTRDDLLAILRAEGLAISAYYSPPLYRAANQADVMCNRELPNTEWLAARYLQLPVGELISLLDIDKIGELLRFIWSNADAINRRIGEEWAH